MKLNLGNDGKPAMAESKGAATIKGLKAAKEAYHGALDKCAAATEQAKEAAFKIEHATTQFVNDELKEAHELLAELGSNFPPLDDEPKVAPPAKKAGLFSK